MSLQSYIRAKIQRLKSMVKGKDQRTVRFSPIVAEEIDRLVAEGKYSSLSDLVNRAVHELLHKEEMNDRIRKLVQEEIQKALDRSS